MIKIRLEMTSQYIFLKNLVLYEIHVYTKKIEGDEYLCPFTLLQ